LPFDTILVACLGVTFVVFAVSHMAAWWTYRSLVDYQYLVARDEWERNGRPEGGQITRQQIGFWNLGNIAASGTQVESWTAERPEWMIGDLRALKTYRRFRIWSIVRRIAFWAMFASFIGFAVASGAW
jgi:hypothetical protein